MIIYVVHLSEASLQGQLAGQGIQRVVINQPGLRPGQPGAQITVPLSTLQVSVGHLYKTR